MKEHPILFSAEMVKAILEDRKTQTRRVIKPQPEKQLEILTGDWWTYYWMNGGMWNDAGKIARCPYGRFHDRLWVRETWAHDDMYCKDIRCGNIDHIWWRANEERFGTAESFAGDAHWHPSIFMSRWASRITLEIVNIRVERVQDISRDDAKAEGMSSVWEWNKDRYAKHPEHFTRSVLNPYVANYSVLWDELNTKRGYSWKANPWVWVIEFKAVQS